MIKTADREGYSGISRREFLRIAGEGTIVTLMALILGKNPVLPQSRSKQDVGYGILNFPGGQAQSALSANLSVNRTGCNLEGQSDFAQITGPVCSFLIPSVDKGIIQLAGINDNISGTSLTAYLEQGGRSAVKVLPRIEDKQLLRALKEPMSIDIFALSSNLQVHIIESINKSEPVGKDKNVLSTEKTIVTLQKKGDRWTVNKSLDWGDLPTPTETEWVGYRAVSNRVKNPDSFFVINPNDGRLIIGSNAETTREGLNKPGAFVYEINTIDVSPRLVFKSKTEPLTQTKSRFQ